MAECEYSNGLETEENVFWNSKLYKDQEATVMDALFENSKKRLPKVSYRALKAIGGKKRKERIWARRLHKQNSYIHI
jgi:hypothetical protein